MTSLVANRIPRPRSSRADHRHRRPVTVRAAVLVVGLAMLAGGAAVAQQPAPLRIAVVDLDRVFLESPLGKQLREELSKLEETTRAELEKHARQIEELQQSMAGKSPEEQRVLARRREDAELALRRVRDDAQRQAVKLETDRRAEIEKQLQPIFEKLQEEQSYDLILNKTPGLVVFVKSSIEITEEVLKRVGAGS